MAPEKLSLWETETGLLHKHINGIREPLKSNAFWLCVSCIVTLTALGLMGMPVKV
jgi:hypothetical protein